MYGNMKKTYFKEHLRRAASEKWQYFILSQVCFCKKGVLNNLTIFAGKQLCQKLFFNKAGGLKPATLLKKRLRFAKFLSAPI